MERTRRAPIVLVCTECKARNYKTTKRASAAVLPGTDPGGATEPVELKKFCKTCQKHTVHKETK
jgi:large subunit ribosomal protein L33